MLYCSNNLDVSHQGTFSIAICFHDEILLSAGGEVSGETGPGFWFWERFAAIGYNSSQKQFVFKAQNLAEQKHICQLQQGLFVIQRIIF